MRQRWPYECRACSAPGDSVQWYSDDPYCFICGQRGRRLSPGGMADVSKR